MSAISGRVAKDGDESGFPRPEEARQEVVPRKASPSGSVATLVHSFRRDVALVRARDTALCAVCVVEWIDMALSRHRIEANRPERPGDCARPEARLPSLAIASTMIHSLRLRAQAIVWARGLLAESPTARAIYGPIVGLSVGRSPEPASPKRVLDHRRN